MVAAIESAIAALAASLPAASHRMQQGESVGVVLSASSRQLTPETVTADAPQEMGRYVAKRGDFPALEMGSAVQVDDLWHICTSCRTDPVGASVFFGLSAPLDAVHASYRRPGSKLRQPLDVLALESDVLDPVSDCVAPTTARAWFVAVSREHWLDVTQPQVGDEITIDGTTMRVAAVAKHDGCWVLTCRARR